MYTIPAPTITDDDGTEQVLPSKFELCPRCQGKGTHVNPSVDGNGITQSEMDEQGPEFLEDYLSGVYDVDCQKCGGARVVAVVDRKRCTPEQLGAWDAWQHEEQQLRAIEAAERRYGC